MAQSIWALFKSAVARRGDKVAAQYKVAGAWRDVTWAELGALAEKASAALVKLGVKPKDNVCILSHTRLEWTIADVGILGAGAATVPIYQSSTGDDTRYILDDAGCVLAFAEDQEQLQKLREIRADLPKVKKVVCFTSLAVDKSSDWEMTWEQFLDEGAAYLAAHQGELRARGESLGPDDVLTIIYTSGTTGRPKGAVLTHANMLYEAESLASLGLINADDVQFLFLPLAHVFAKAIEVSWFKQAHVMAFWEGDQTKIVDNLAEVRPTFVCSVPRIFEKVYAKVTADMARGAGLAGVLGRWALREAQQASSLERAGKDPSSFSWTVARWLVLSKVAEKLAARFGGRLRFFVSGGAPLSQDIAYFFKYAGVKICEGYGLTETSAGASIVRPSDVRIGTVGTAFPGCEIKIAGDGEILIRGPNVMKGYWNNPEATKEAIDGDGWFHTGDIGVIDEGGFIRITDRKKDLIITAGGKNIAPQNIENTLKSKSSLISQVVVHGDQRKYLSALITVDPDNLKSWASQQGIQPFEYQAVTQSPALASEIQSTINELNRQLASYETLKKFKILDHDFEIGLQLTPTLKVKRKLCNERYKDIFDGFYGEN